MSEAADPLQSRLQALLQAGVDRWDAAETRVVAHLLERAHDSAAPLAAHLTQRADAHLTQLEAAFAHAKARAEQSLAQLPPLASANAAALTHTLQDKLASGAFAELQRLVRRAQRPRPELPAELRAQQHARLQAAAERRGLGAAATRANTPELLAAALYRDSAAGANARRAVARAAAAVPVDAGHYNAQRVAARALQTLGAYPGYLQAQLARLETLALLRPAPVPKPASGKTRRKARGSPD